MRVGREGLRCYGERGRGADCKGWGWGAGGEQGEEGFARVEGVGVDELMGVLVRRDFWRGRVNCTI